MTMCSELHRIGKCPYGGRNVYSLAKKEIFKLDERPIKCATKTMDLEEFHAVDLVVNSVDPREFVSPRGFKVPEEGRAILTLNGCQILAVTVGEIRYLPKIWIQAGA